MRNLPKKLWLPGGQLGGPVSLKSAFFAILVIFLQTWAEKDARNLPNTFLTPRGSGGRGRGFWNLLMSNPWNIDKGKMLKNRCIVLAIFQHFSFGSPFDKKVVKTNSNFERLHEAYAENFSCLSHWEHKKSHIPASISENPVPLFDWKQQPKNIWFHGC